ncbi:MAG: MltA domain-containing protein [Planctomycetota bacterium]
MNRSHGWTALLILTAMLAGCQPQAPTATEAEDFTRPLPPGQLALRKITDPTQVPDIGPACRNTYLLKESVQNSLSYLSKPSSEQFFPYGQISHAHAIASLEAIESLLEEPLSPQQLQRRIMQDFDFYTSVGWDGRGTVLFTGYYTPILQASMQPTARFRYPLFSPPEGLVKGPNGEILGIRGPDGQLRQMPPRKQLPSAGLLGGNELVWLEDPFEVYVAHVQGSAILELRDGERITVGYAATNGHEYRSIAPALIADGAIEKDKMSLRAMIDYFQAHPEKVEQYVDTNPRFVFFRISQTRPRGSLNEPVTPMRSIATDKDVYPRGCLALIRAPLPRDVGGRIRTLEYAGFALDQDTGGAIRAPGRCDIYVGVGDRAGEQAGRTYHKGRLYYLFLKPERLGM